MNFLITVVSLVCLMDSEVLGWDLQNVGKRVVAQNKKIISLEHKGKIILLKITTALLFVCSQIKNWEKLKNTFLMTNHYIYIIHGC